MKSLVTVNLRKCLLTKYQILKVAVDRYFTICKNINYHLVEENTGHSKAGKLIMINEKLLKKLFWRYIITFLITLAIIEAIMH